MTTEVLAPRFGEEPTDSRKAVYKDIVDTLTQNGRPALTVSIALKRYADFLSINADITAAKYQREEVQAIKARRRLDMFIQLEKRYRKEFSGYAQTMDGLKNNFETKLITTEMGHSPFEVKSSAGINFANAMRRISKRLHRIEKRVSSPPDQVVPAASRT